MSNNPQAQKQTNRGDNTDVTAQLQQLREEIAETLQPLPPSDGVNRYLERECSDLADRTLRGYQRKLQYFVQYCNKKEVVNLNEIDGRFIDDYQHWRRYESTDSSLSVITMQDDMYLLRDLLQYLESIDAVTAGLSEATTIPTPDDEDGVRDIELSADRAGRILEYLGKYHYASGEHVVWVLHCETGRRPGGIHSLDVDDIVTDVENPYIDIQHRPEQGTRLKNGAKGETQVSIPNHVAEILDAYIASRRPEVTDDYGREPLLASNQGRLSRSCMRRYIYKWTRPCKITGECPHDRDIDDCEAAQSSDVASQCESSLSPYAARHGYISQRRRDGVPVELISERCDVGADILDRHYDERDEAERREMRREIIQEYVDENGGYGQ
jgi:integrase